MPTTQHTMLVHVMVVFLAIAHSLAVKEDSESMVRSIRRAVILDSKLAQDIPGSLLCQYLHLNRHIFKSGGDQYRRKSI
jgi:hypothetical protein